MKHNRMITPEGMKDILLEECTLRRTLREKAASRLRRSGYREVVTPGVEFYDLFDPSHTGFAQEDLYKMTDNKGRLLVMRPDCTLPIARLAATRLQALPRPLRLWYDEMVYRNNPGLAGRDDEQLQCGMELLGAGGLKADLEALFLASCILQDMDARLPHRAGPCRHFPGAVGVVARGRCKNGKPSAGPLRRKTMRLCPPCWMKSPIPPRCRRCKSCRGCLVGRRCSMRRGRCAAAAGRLKPFRTYKTCMKSCATWGFPIM